MMIEVSAEPSRSYFIYIHSDPGAAVLLLCVLSYYCFPPFWLRRHRARFHKSVPGPGGLNIILMLYAAARRTSMYSHIPACCCLVCCYTSVAAAAAACCCCSSSGAAWRNLFPAWFIASNSSVFISLFKHDFYSICPLAVLSQFQHTYIPYHTSSIGITGKRGAKATVSPLRRSPRCILPEKVLFILQGLSLQQVKLVPLVPKKVHSKTNYKSHARSPAIGQPHIVPVLGLKRPSICLLCLP